MRVMLGVTRAAFDASADAAQRRRVELNELTALLRENDPLFLGYDRTRILNAIGVLHLALGDLLHALAFFEAMDAVKGPPAPATIRRGQLNRALVLIRVGDTRRAEALLLEALEAAPRSSRALVWRANNLLGLCRMYAGDLRGARAALDEARRGRPGTLHNDSILNEAKLLNRGGDARGALELLGPLEEVPAPMGGYEWMLEIARANIMLGEFRAAHLALDKLTEGHPGRYFVARATVLRARLASVEGRVEDACRLLEVADELAEAAGSLAVVEEVAAVRQEIDPAHTSLHETANRWLDA
ncbi:MAG: tetratricopeptide repeat protein, partial [Myxococcota bacterium]